MTDRNSLVETEAGGGEQGSVRSDAKEDRGRVSGGRLTTARAWRHESSRNIQATTRAEMSEIHGAQWQN